jgi:hypothetical protein
MIWLSVHIFYNASIDDFLAKVVKPFTDTLLKTGAAKLIFFIRYKEKGPHLRIRIQSEAEVLEKIIKPNVKMHFENYLQMYPSSRIEPNWLPVTPEKDKWLPNNSVFFIDYEPEIARYGGNVGIQLAERQFFSSTKAVLGALGAVLQNDWSYQHARGVAIKLHLAMVWSMRLTIDEAADFFNAVSAHWLPFAIARERVTKAQYQHHLLTMADNFEQAFQEQKEDFISYHAAIWEILNEEKDFEEDFMNDWIRENKRLALEFDLAQAQNLLEPRPDEFQMKINSDIAPEKTYLWQYFADFVHLTNNRLGIGNEDESYLAYLMMRSLEEML